MKHFGPRVSREPLSPTEMRLRDLPIDPGPVEEAIGRKFTVDQLENMCEYVRHRTLANKHGNMSGTCMEIDDDDGEQHHNSKERESEREADKAAAKLRRSGVMMRFVKVSARWKDPRWIFTNKHGKRFELAESDIDLSSSF